MRAWPPKASCGSSSFSPVAARRGPLVLSALVGLVLLATGLRIAHGDQEAAAPPAPLLNVKVDQAAWRMEVSGPDGALLFSSSPVFALAANPARWLRLTNVVSTSPPQGGAASTYVVNTEDPGTQARITLDFANGNLRLNMTLNSGGTVVKVGELAGLPADEHFFGGGERFLSADHRGRRLDNWIADRRLENYGDSTYLAMPYFMSTRGYGLLLDTTTRNVFDFGATRAEQRTIEAQTSSLSYQVLYGPQPLQILDRLTQLTGRPPLPPRWAFGVWSTDLGGQTTVLARAQKYRDLRIPITAIFTYDYNDDQTNIGWPMPTYGPLPPGPYPDLRAMNDQLHALGFRSLTYVGPDFHAERPSFQSPSSQGFLIKNPDGSPYMIKQFNLSHIDLTNPAAAAWWRGLLRRTLVDLNFDGWMQDLGDIAPAEALFSNGQSGASVHNAFPLYYHRVALDEILKTKPDAIALLRSGWTGIQPLARAAWTGDEVLDWSPDAGLPSVIPAMLSMGLSGISTVGTNIGGYVSAGPIRGADLPPAEERELWIRWLEVGAANPIMRHWLGDKQGKPSEILSDEQTIGLFTNYARWHTALFPYLYSYAAVASQTGAPIMRHLVLQFPSDPQTYNQDGEYMLGDWLLVTPVLKPGKRQHSFYLPAGQWIDYWTGASYTGPAQATVPAPLERLPVLARAGAILPLLPDGVQTLTQPNLDASLVIQVFPGPDSSFTLWDGTTFSQSGAGGHLSSARSSKVRQLEWRILRPSPPAGVTTDGAPLPQAAALASLGTAPSGWFYDQGSKILYIRSQFQEGSVDVQG